MRQTLMTIGIVLFVSIGLIGLFSGANSTSLLGLFSQRTTMPSTIATCTPVTEAEALALAEKIIGGFNKLDPQPFDQAIDWDILLGEALTGIELSDKERDGFLNGAKTGVMKNGGPGVQTITGLGQPDRMELLRARTIDGHQHVIARALIGEGFNYIDFHIARTPSGQVRLIDYKDLAMGRPLSEIMGELCLPLLSELTRAPLQKIVTGNQTEKDWEVIAKELPHIRTLIQSGKHQEAYDKARALPAIYRESKPGCYLLMQITQQLDNKIYTSTLADIDKRFPDDPTMGLMLLDWHLLEGRTDKAIAIINRIEKEIGGDGYLDGIRATSCLLAKDLKRAEKYAVKACERVPHLIDIWWVRVTIALQLKDHVAVSSLLDEIGQRFNIAFADDLSTISEYADYAASPEYKTWNEKRQANTKTKSADEKKDE